MDIQSLGYMRIVSEDPLRWSGFACDVLGMQRVEGDRDGTLNLRMDERHHRVAVEAGDRDGGACYGWELAGAAEVDAAAGELEAAGVEVVPGTKEEMETRRVAGLVGFTDPAGHRVELFCGQDLGEGLFTSPRDLSGFKTGELGMGHVVLMVPDLEPAVRFYRDVLGFRISDFVSRPFKATFLRTNPRHHSLALLEVGVSALHHLMVELNDIDDVGRGYDLVQSEGIPLARTLGRHANDRMISFYARTPSGFEIEYGYGGRLLDGDGDEPVELAAISSWGHHPA